MALTEQTRSRIQQTLRMLERDGLEHQRSVDRAAVVETHRVAQPLPDLGPRNLCRRCVFHQVMDRGCADACEQSMRFRPTAGQSD